MTVQRALHTLVTITLILIVLAGVAPAAGQGDTGSTSPLLDMLAQVPDTVYANDGDVRGTIRFTDYQAYFGAEGIAALPLTTDVETLVYNFPRGALSRLVLEPDALAYDLLVGVGKMEGIVGFEWFEDVIYALIYGSSPYTGLILGGEFDVEAIGTALSARDYETTEIDGITVWHRLEDGAWDAEVGEMADPFMRETGHAARVMVLPGYVVNTRFWEMTENAVAVAQGTQPTLAERPDYRALVDAITAPGGVLIQAVFYDVWDVGFLPADPRPTENGLASMTDYGSLQPFTLAVLADRQEGEDQVHLIALVYPDAEAAAAAAVEVARRLTTWTFPFDAPPVIEEYGAALNTWVYESAPTENAVAVIEVRYPWAEHRFEREGDITGSGHIFRAWWDALIQYRFYLLTVDMP